MQRNVFSSNQLNVDVSRIQSKNRLKILCCGKDGNTLIKQTLLLIKKYFEEMVYLSCNSIDKIGRGTSIDESAFSPEFINGLKFSGIPKHRLVLKVGVVIMLLRNIDQSYQSGLCNGTRLQVVRLTRTSIQAQ